MTFIAAPQARADRIFAETGVLQIKLLKLGFCKSHGPDQIFAETGVLQYTTGLLIQTSRTGSGMNDETGVSKKVRETGVLQSACAETGVLQHTSLKPGFCESQGLEPGFCTAQV